ncbi:MAG: methionine synthase [Prevotella sp.]|nr:methionine synthase [Prevotella sp.]
MTQKTLSFDDLRIALADIFEQMGYRDAEPDEETQKETQAIIQNVRLWLRPQFCYQVAVQQPDFEMGSIILRQLRNSEAYALFICTSGLEYEAYQQRLKEQGDMVQVFIADALGSVIAEKCADQMEQHLQESINKLGWRHTNRFSPGYCGWHVSQQQRLFPLFEGHTCGVQLTDSSLMVPIKSVSGIIGLGKKVRRLDYTCGLCDFKQCYKRIVRNSLK